MARPRRKSNVFVLQFFLNALGLFLATLPEGLLAAVCRGLGWLVIAIPSRRRRTVFANLHHAFPDQSPAQRRALALESVRRSLEMSLFVLISPHFTKTQMQRHCSLDPELQRLVAEFQKSPQPLVLFTPHFSLMEANTCFPALVQGSMPEMAAIYRPFDAPGLESWVKRTRERWGLKLLSRKEGFFQAVDILRRQGLIVVLFDQNAGDRGALTLFMDRVCSTSELGGLLAEKCHARVAFIYTEHTGFFRAVIHGGYIDTGPRAADVLFATNRWLENKLRQSEQYRVDWLWLHARWRHQDHPTRRFRLQSKRDLLPEHLAWLGLAALPRRTRFWLRLPNWLGDVVMALPLLRALRLSRPDAEITLLVQPAFAPLLERLGVADRLIALPPRGPGYWKFFRQLREEYPDVHVLFTNSARGDFEARLAGAPQRFGMHRPGHPRPFLTHAWNLPSDLDESRLHQTAIWEEFFRHFGLQGELDFSPFAWPAPSTPAPPGPVIGCICGTENTPEKRWPVERWRELLAALFAAHPLARVQLFGVAGDAPITTAVAAGFPPERVANLAGKTNLLEFADALRACATVVCNDTGGMHLANALGVPIVAVYGPTNPIRTGPIFNAPCAILQPAHCPPAGGSPLAELPAARVLAALAPWLTQA
jgi:ADP-heptose:LPS heptosyltransferase/lauroyl/myristoyl acyltransferase